jgi:CheY-like chemotaxis protein
VGGWPGAVEPLHLTRCTRAVADHRATLATVVKKILVVEDDPVNQMILSDFLRANGYETVAASTGPEGIERFESDAPDLLLVDVQLPRKNGFELVREIKSRPTGTKTPILLMSAVYSDRDQSNRTIQLGALADGYLSKPFDLVYLLAQVKQLLGEAE